MQRKSRIMVACQKQIFELCERGYSIRRIAKILKMCRKSVKKHAINFEKIIQNQACEDTINSENNSSDTKTVIINFPKWFQAIDYKSFLMFGRGDSKDACIKGE